MMAGLFLAIAYGQLANDPRFPSALQEKCLDATVYVYHPATLGEGSGVVIRFENGFAYILTSAHVAPDKGANADDIEVTFFPRGKRRDELQPIKSRVQSRMLNEDLALIRIGLKQAPPGVLPLCPRNEAPSKHPDKPIPVLATGLGPRGTPEAQFDLVREHKFVKKPDGSAAFHWEADTPQPIGRSGGPLIDVNGRVIGICSGTRDKKGYYLSIYEIENALRKNGWDFLNR